MGQSVLVFISHSSEDKEALIEPVVADLEACYINVWLDKRKILPGDNLRQSIFKNGLDKADVALIFFTKKSLKSHWVDKEIKHVLREETKKGNDFNLNKIISIFDSTETYTQITERYPELTDDLLHLMPENYNKLQLGQLISAIWSKYLSLQGGDVATQRQILEKDKELFKKDQDLQKLQVDLENLKSEKSISLLDSEFSMIHSLNKIENFIKAKDILLMNRSISQDNIGDVSDAVALGLIEPTNYGEIEITNKGKDFFRWLMFSNQK